MASSLRIFDYNDPIAFLNAYLSISPKRGHGLQRQWAQCCNCQPAFISMVLRHKAQLSAEQAESLARHLGLTNLEGEYFVTLVLVERAGTASLKDMYRRRLKEIIAQTLDLQKRMRISKQVLPEDQPTYYSHWLYTAIHMALSIDDLRMPEALAKYFGISKAVLQRYLNFLVGSGLAERDGAKYLPTHLHLHLTKESPLIARHHMNWRIKAIDNLYQASNGIHYSGVITLSKSDADKLANRLSLLLEEISALVKPSHPEELRVMNIDFFGLAQE